MRYRQLSRTVRSLLELQKQNQASSSTQKASIYTVAKAQTFPDHVRVVDYRSDTISYPSDEMREVMYKAKVGDDVYGEDPTVNELEEKGAAMLGKEAALFVASGTMANLLAIMTHSEKRGCEIIVGDESHILLWEQAGAAQVAGVQLRTVVNKPNGTFDLNEMMSRIRNNENFSFLPKTSLICVENTHNNCGGRVLPLEWLKQLGEAVRPLNIALHMDGARFFNSAVSLGVPPRQIVQDFDSVAVCLSKGLGAPIGSLLMGSKQFIDKSRHLRKLLGGGMRQVGLMAAAGIYALDNMIDRLKLDHQHAREIAKAIQDTGSKIISVDLDSLETNILLINIDISKVSVADVCQRLAMVTEEELKDESPSVIKILPWSKTAIRLVVCCNNNINDLEASKNKFRRVIEEYENGVFIV